MKERTHLHQVTPAPIHRPDRGEVQPRRLIQHRVNHRVERLRKALINGPITRNLT